MYTLGTTTTRIIHKEESWGIAVGAVSTAVVKVGQIVKMNADGTVSPTAAVTDVPFGMITKGTESDTRLDVTVQSFFVAILTAVASGPVITGNDLASNGVSGDHGTYIVASAATHPIIGMALTDGADTAEITVGLYRTPKKF